MYYFTLTFSFIMQWASWFALFWFTLKVLNSEKSPLRKLLSWLGYYLLFLLINIVAQLVVTWINLQSPIFYEVIEASFGGITASATKNAVMQEYLIQVAGFALFNSLIWQLILSALAVLWFVLKRWMSKKKV